MYSTSIRPWKDIKHARAVLTSFAVQIVSEKLVAEMKVVTRVESGLHVSTQKRRGMQWELKNPAWGPGIPF